MRDVVLLGGSAGMTVVQHHLLEVYPDIRIAVLDENATVDSVVSLKREVPIVRDWDFDRARRFYGADGDAFRSFLPLFSYPKVKKILVDKALAHGLEPAPTFVYPGVFLYGEVDFGLASFIGAGCYVADESKIGSYVSAGNAVIGHHVHVGDYCTVGTNTSLLGFCEIGEGVQVSPGAVLRTGVKVADWVTIGIQAAVVSDVTTPGVTVGGVPAREIVKRSEPGSPG